MAETKKSILPGGEIVIYKNLEGPDLQVKLEDETVWLTQAQMGVLFQKDVRTINEHIKNVFKESELSQNSVIRKFRITAADGKAYNTNFYNLDVIISVGYRVKSKHGTQFRIWATQRLRDYILQGFVINEKRLRENQEKKLKELEQANRLFLQVIESRRAEGYEKELLKIITDYTNTWVILNKYDKGELGLEDVSKRKSVNLDYEEVKKAVEKFKARLSAKKEAGDLFGKEVSGKFKAVLGNVYQTFDRKELYPSIEEKAAHLLYFCVKDHPFADGNKRIGSLTFLLYLIENRCLYNRHGERKINDTALAALALLIAESRTDQKEVCKVGCHLISKK